MSELILSIFLGILLLLVILLLVWELIATYPVWKQFKTFYSAQPAALPPKAGGNNKEQKVLILSIAGAGLICLVGGIYLVQQSGERKKALQVKAETAITDAPAKHLTAHSADSAVFFRLQTKWQDGKLYGNSTITFSAGTVQRLSDCRYYLLDADGFLIKSIFFSSSDFLLLTAPGGEGRSLLNKFNTELSIDDYLKIEKLQVALDGKILPEIAIE